MPTQRKGKHRFNERTIVNPRKPRRGDRPQAGGGARKGATPAQWEHPINRSPETKFAERSEAKGGGIQAGVQPLTKGAAEYQVNRQMSFLAAGKCRSQRSPNVVPSGAQMSFLAMGKRRS